MKNFFKMIKVLGLLRTYQTIKGIKTCTEYLRGYMCFSIVNALEEIGVLQFMLNNTSINLEEFCRKKQLNFEKTKISMNYLYEMDLFIKKGENIFLLTKKGKNFFKYGFGFIILGYGYSPIFNNLERIFKNKMTYNKDIFRLGKFVGKGSGLAADALPFPIMQDMIKKYGFKNLLDLGCGSAKFLIKTCKKLNINAYGIDINDETIKFANQAIKNNKLENRIKIYSGDIFNLENVDIKEAKDIDLISSTYVLHELLYKNQNIEKIKSLLKDLSTKFPKSKILICETKLNSLDRLKKQKSILCEHHLFHELSEQGVPSDEVWKNIFSESNLIIEKSFSYKGILIYLLDKKN